MKVDARITYATLREVPTLAGAAEEIGVDGIWFTETSHDPFLPAVLAAEHTARVSIGTAVAIAFTRSPTLLAYLAWDLAAQSGGRFVLGLGTQVKAHIIRRFGMTWDPPAPKLRESVQAIHAVWDAWRTRDPLRFRGRFYNLSLMTPFFTPAPLDAKIPIFTAGVNPPLCRIAGQVADGFVVHPFHTRAYLRDVVLPAVRTGRTKTGRDTVPFTIAATVFTATGETAGDVARARDEVRRTVAFYASTPSYRRVLAHHGWQEVGERLSGRAARGEWTAMAAEVSDEMLEAVAVIGRAEEIGPEIMDRYRGLVDRIGFYEPFVPADSKKWRSLLDAARG
ncbi:MAG TPA: TIGR03617 family F420-dependent LLM class oxidoreductase [bacterium]|nr:TIGR03617 family F420-dependent LLM class oxidoreductase [bacterium]